MKKSSPILFGAGAAFFFLLVALGVWRYQAARHSGPEEMLGVLLRSMPEGSSGVLYIDAAQLRQARFAQKLFAWAPKPEADPEYARFVEQTGFNYERDLARVGFSAVSRGSRSYWFAIADGAFDQKKIAAYLAKISVVDKRGGHDIYSVPALLPLNTPGQGKSKGAPASAWSKISFTFLGAGRIAATSDADLSVYLDQKEAPADAPQWEKRFKRLAGAPIFVVLRQDDRRASSLGAEAPGGWQSPQLSALLAQLTWCTLAGQPQNDSLRIVAEGESPSEATARQLADMLNGVLILAEAGLNDRKMRERLNPQTRSAYLALLKSADISRLDRDDLKAVRVVLDVTPGFLDAATWAQPAPK